MSGIRAPRVQQWAVLCARKHMHARRPELRGLFVEQPGPDTHLDGAAQDHRIDWSFCD